VSLATPEIESEVYFSVFYYNGEVFLG